MWPRYSFTLAVCFAGFLVGCQNKDKKAPADSWSNPAAQVGNTRSAEEVAQGWTKVADFAKEKAAAINTKLSLSNYSAQLAPAANTCLNPEALYSSVKISNPRSKYFIYYPCDAKPACRLMITEFDDPLSRSWPAQQHEELSTLILSMRGVKTMAVSEACGSVARLNSDLIAYGIPDSEINFVNKTDKEFDALIAETITSSAPSSSTDSEESDIEEEDIEFLLLPKFQTSSNEFSTYMQTLFPAEEDKNPRTSLLKGECESIFASYKKLFEAIESDSRNAAFVMRDWKNKLSIDPSVRIFSETQNPYRELFVNSFAFEGLENGQAISSGYIGIKGDADRVLSQLKVDMKDNSIDPSSETLLADVVLNKIYFYKTQGSYLEVDNTKTKERNELSIAMDLGNYSIETIGTFYSNGSIAGQGSSTFRLNENGELTFASTNSDGQKLKLLIQKDPKADGCLVKAN